MSLHTFIDTHYAAFDQKTAWYMISSIFKGQVMEMIIECAMSMQRSHGLLTFPESLFGVLVEKGA